MVDKTSFPEELEYDIIHQLIRKSGKNGEVHLVAGSQIEPGNNHAVQLYIVR